MAIWKQIPTRAAGSDRRSAVFLDRDGVIIRDQGYLSDPDGVEVLPGVAEAMIRAKDHGFLLIGVSNQSGIGRGYFGLADFEAVMVRVERELAAQGTAFDGFYYCPHSPEENCDCRKPRQDMLSEAAAGVEWDRRRSWVVGDKISDVEFGQRAGFGSILVRSGYGDEVAGEVTRSWGSSGRVLIADDLRSAIEMIVRRDAAASEGGDR